MSANIDDLKGEVITNPEGQERDVELLLQSFFKSLVEEQRLITSAYPNTVSDSEAQ